MSRTPAPNRRGSALPNLATGLRRMAPGSAGGQFPAASPARPRVVADGFRVPHFQAVFHHAGPADGSVSGPHPVPYATPLQHLTVAATDTASTDSVIEAYVDGTSVGTVTLPAGDSFATVDIEESAPAGSLVTVAATTVGDGLGGVTAIVGSRGT